MELTGTHHVSALSADIAGTHRFYTEVLGLRLVIKTVNQDEPTMYHLFFGDGVGSPGSEMTVFDLPRAAPEKPGNNSISLTSFRVPEGSLEFWRARLGELEVPQEGISSRDGRRVLNLRDGVGTFLSLVEDTAAGANVPWEASPVPGEHQIRGLGYVAITVPDLDPTDRFLREGLGLEYSHPYSLPEAPGSRAHVYRMRPAGPAGEVHVRVREDLPRARYGSGGVHHVALRVPELHASEQWVERLAALGYPNSGVVDRFYFRSVYVREPNDVLFELATDGPGFEVDGPIDGARLRLPPFLEPRRAEIERRLAPLDT